MRTFEDGSGRRWDAAIGDESYGSQRLIFAVRGGREFRAQLLEFTGRFAAEQWLLHRSEDELRRMLEAAPDWHPGG